MKGICLLFLRKDLKMSIERAIELLEQLKKSFPYCPEYPKAFNHKTGLVDEAIRELKDIQKSIVNNDKNSV